MKRILYLFPLLFGIFACGAQPAPTQNVGSIVSATLTAIAQNNPQVPALQPTITPISVQAQPTIQTVPPVQPTALQQVAQPTHISSTCSASWFFNFDNKHLSLGSFCPEPVKTLDAVGQDFEGGRALRYAGYFVHPPCLIGKN